MFRKKDFVDSCSYLGIFTVKVEFAEEKNMGFVMKKKQLLLKIIQLCLRYLRATDLICFLGHFGWERQEVIIEVTEGEDFIGGQDDEVFKLFDQISDETLAESLPL